MTGVQTCALPIFEHEQGAYALFRAAITIPNGGSATGWGSETVEDFGDYLEKAETKSLGRALAALGYGTLHALELDEGDSVADSPIERRAAPAPIAPREEPNPELEAAKASLVAAMQAEKWSLARVIETAGFVWPHITSKEDLGTLTPIQLTRLAEVVTGESIINLDVHGVKRIMPAAVAIGMAS